MFAKGKRSPSSAPSLTLHSTHLGRRRSPFGMVRALEKASDGLPSGGSRRLAVVAVSRFQNRISASYSLPGNSWARCACDRLVRLPEPRRHRLPEPRAVAEQREEPPARQAEHEARRERAHG